MSLSKKRKIEKGMIDETYKDSKQWLDLVNSILKIYDTRRFSLDSKEKTLIYKLKNEVKKIPVLNKERSQAENDWIKHINLIKELILNDNPSEFLGWSVVQYTMNVTNSFFIAKELAFLINSREWHHRWEKVLSEINIGHFVPFIFYPRCSGNTIHTCYLISQFEEKAQKDIDELDFIFEFGGGYGNLCRLIHKLGFKGRYLIFDFPVLTSLQKFYLKSAGLKVYNQNQIVKEKRGICCISNIKDLYDLVFRLAHKERKNNLFVASWSLSESSEKVRGKIGKILGELFGFFMICYQDAFGEINNHNYFNNFKKNHRYIKWHDWSILHLPGHNFLVGSPKDD